MSAVANQPPADPNAPALSLVTPPDPLQVLKEMTLPEEFNERLRAGTIDGTPYTPDAPPTPVGDAPVAPAVPSLEPTPDPAVAAPAPAEAPKPKPGVKPIKLAKKFVGTKAGESFTPEKVIELTQAAAREGAAAAVREIASTAPAAPVAAELELLPGEQRQLEVMTEMERLHPDKYKGLVEKTKTYLTEYENRIAAWEAANPGQQWNEQGDEDKALKAELLPKWDDADFGQAERELTVAPLRQENQALKERLDRIEAGHQQAELAPVVVARAVETGRVAAEDLGVPADIIGPNGVFDQAKVAEFTKADPDGAPVLLRAVAHAENFAAAATTLFAGHTVDNPQMANGVAQAAIDLETSIKALPVAEQVFEGKRFVSRPDFFKLPAKERAGCWTIDASDVISFAMTDEKNGILTNGKRAAAAERQRIEQIAEARGWKPKAASSSTTAPPAAPSRQPAAPRAAPKPRTTDTGGATVAAPIAFPAAAPGSFLARMRHGTIDHTE